MQHRGWLDAELGYAERNRKAKCYCLTAIGRRQLAVELSRWSQYTEAVGSCSRARTRAEVPCSTSLRHGEQCGGLRKSSVLLMYLRASNVVKRSFT
jgi:hypothetical protein